MDYNYLSQIIELEVCTLDAGELTAGVNVLTVTQVGNHLVVTVLGAFGLDLADKWGIDIVRLLSLGQQDDTLEDNLGGIPSRLRLAVLRQGLFLSRLLHLELAATGAAGSLCLELLHRVCRSLDGDKERTPVHLDVLGVHGATAHELLQFRHNFII